MGEDCKVCGRSMVFYASGRTGDPAYVCLTDDAAHRAAAAARKAERETLLRAAKLQPPPPDPALLDSIAAWERPDPEAVEVEP